MSRWSALSRLAVAYGRHEVRRRVRRRGPQLDALLDRYREEQIIPLTSAEREQLPALSRCIGCGLCALVARRGSGGVSAPDLAGTYLRAYHLLPAASVDLRGDEGDLAAAAAACPVGVPLPAVAVMVRRLSRELT